jgi:hypothetical protein
MKGCQRKVIFLKNTGSELFDEAYFILSRESEREEISEDSIVLAASKIISQQIELEGKEKRSKKIKLLLLLCVPFLLGCALSAAVALMIFL